MDTEKKIERIPLGEILSDDDFNCRGFITAESVQDLVSDIANLGLLSPILVQPWTSDDPKIKFRIVCGHRRYLALKILNKRGHPGADKIDCIVYGHLNEGNAYILNLSENVTRKNLNILQEALAIKRFYLMGWTQERIAKELKVLRPWIQVRACLLTLPPEIQQRAAADMLTQHQILEIAGMGSKEEQLTAARAAIDWKLKGNRGSLKNLRRTLKKELKEKSVFETGKARDRTDIGKMQEAIQDALGVEHITARVLGWAAGFVSSADLANDLQAIASQRNKRFKLPGAQ